jgi:hypothetical protein
MEEQITMTAEERTEFEAYKADKAKKEAIERQRQNRDTYKMLVNDTINAMFPTLEEISEDLAKNKAAVYEAFKQALAMKQELYEVKPDQRSNTFTNEDSTRRITLGQYTTDNYDDTVNEGIAKVKEYISSLAKDKESGMLVDAIMKLLSRDQQGNLKASRVMQLRKMADESGNEQFIDGVKIIENSYRPAVSKFYVKAEKKNEFGAWISIPLGMTEA